MVASAARPSDPPTWRAALSTPEAVADALDTLLTINPVTMEPMPGLAESWRAVDPTTWEFKLRRNVKFHDGTPFTADDIVATFSRVFNPPPGVISAYKELFGPVTVTEKTPLMLVTPLAPPIRTESPVL